MTMAGLLPEARDLPSREVHVWSAAISAYADREDDLRSVLSCEEAERALRFRFDRDRTQYVLAHGLLRVLLGSYTGGDPAGFGFAAGPCGKPRVVTSGSPVQPPAFNLSHSGDRILIALSNSSEVGVDVEQWRDVEHEELATFCFSPAERAELRCLERAQVLSGFFACWARKEAYLKALGIGVSRGLDFFDVTVSPARKPRLIQDRMLRRNVAAWALHDIAVGSGYSAALCVRRGVARVRYFTAEGRMI